MTDWREVLVEAMAKVALEDDEVINQSPRMRAMYIQRARTALAVAEPVIRERCAKIIEPSFPRPCDCEDCYCGNRDDADRVAAWDEAAANAKAIREGGEE